MNWMVGLGGAMQQVGGDILKSELADKLEAKREAKAEAREQAREQRVQERRLKEIANTETIQRDGQWVTRKLNVQGDVISEVPTDPYTIKKLQRAEDKEVMSLEKLTTENALGKRELEDYENLSGLERRYKEAQIRERETASEENLAQATRALRTKTDETTATSASAMGVELADSLPDLKKQYTQGDEPIMTSEEFQHLAQGAVLEAAKRGVDAVTFFRAALRGRARQNQSKNK